MKKQYEYFERIRIKYVIAVMHDNYKTSDKLLEAMQSFRAEISWTDFKEGFRLHDEIMSAIDFGRRMWEMRRKYNRLNKKREGVQ